VALRPNQPQNRSDRLAERQAAQDDVFLREVDDAVRQDQMAEAAKRFGIPLAIAAIIGLLAFGGWLIWKDHRDSGMEEHSEELVRAIDRIGSGNLDTASKMLDPVVSDGSSGAAAAARMLKAGIAVEQGRKAEAAKLFAEIAADSAAPQPYRDLAAIREVSVTFDTMKPEDVVAKLKPLATPGNPWFGSAGELVGLAYLKQGKKELAGPLFAAIAKDETLPDTLRARARQLAGLLGVDAITDVDKIVKPQEDGAEQSPVAQ
jgi:hypothetical protein